MRGFVNGVGLLLCTGVAAAQTFNEVADQRGVVYFVEQTPIFGSGLLLADLDNDDDLDLLTLGAFRSPGLFENLGGGYFVERFTIALGSGTGRLSGLTAADYDGDGDRDIFCSVWEGSDILLRNDGNLAFTDVTGAAGLGDTGFGMGCSWGDYDGDGWLDLYLSNRTGTTLSGGGVDTTPNRMYRNQGDGTFSEVAVAETVDAGLAPSLQAGFVDLDRDGDVDLYLANDKGSYQNCMSWRNQLWENQNGSLVEVSAGSGADVCLDAMSITLGDANLDGRLDMYSTNTPAGNALLIQQADGTFVESAAAYGVGVNQLGWGAVLIDYDLDQDQDLYVCNATTFNMMFRSQPTLPWPEAAIPLGLADTGVSYCVARGDIDNDGDDDLVLSNDGTRVRIYLNNAATGNSLQVRAHGTWPNLDAIGATILVEAGGLSQVRAVAAGSAYKSQHELRQTFGLGTHTAADRIEIVWPGGETRELLNYPAGSWVAYPDAALGDVNGNGTLGPADLRALKDCLASGTFAPGCEVFDFDGDGDVDQADAAEFNARRGKPDQVIIDGGNGIAVP